MTPTRLVGEAVNEGRGRRRYLLTEPLVMRFHTHPVMLWVLRWTRAVPRPLRLRPCPALYYDAFGLIWLRTIYFD
jgi:hypothetical protein